MTRTYRPLLADADLAYPQYLTLRALWEQPARPRTVGSIGQRLRIETGTLTPILKRLELAGYISRDRDPHDERRLLVTVTDAGLALRDRVASVPEQLAACVGLDAAVAVRIRDELKDLVLRSSVPQRRARRPPHVTIRHLKTRHLRKDHRMNPGDEVDDVEAVDQTGTPVRLSELTAAGPVVLFFYPEAMTKGCTAESCHFRDLSSDFQQVGARAVGISADPAERQARFDEMHGLGLPLLSDPERRITSMLGVKRPEPLFNRRMTFVIGADRRLIEIIKSEISMDSHADRALAVLRARSEEQPVTS